MKKRNPKEQEEADSGIGAAGSKGVLEMIPGSRIHLDGLTEPRDPY